MKLLSLESLESHLKYAEAQLTKATSERVRAADIENQWHTEVMSVRSLIEVYRRRLGDGQQGVPDAHIQEQLPGVQEVVNQNAEQTTSISNIDWIEQRVVASGRKGLNVPEVVREAALAGVKMHPNYPYTALRNLVEKKKLVKDGLRYYGSPTT